MHRTKYAIRRFGTEIVPRGAKVELVCFTNPTMLRPAMARIRYGHDVLEVLPDSIE